MGISSYDAQIARALWIKGKSLWLAIGRTTAWPATATAPEDVVPAAETPGTHAIDEPIVYLRPTLISLARPVSSSGSVSVNRQQYAFVADANAYAEYGRFIYCRGIFDVEEYEGLPFGAFRQTALYSGLVPAAGHENDQWLAPANVSNHGILEYFSSHNVVAGSSADVEIIVECR